MKKGWEVKKLGEICTIERGSSPRPIDNFITSDSSGYNWIKIGDTKNINKYLYSTKERITIEGTKKSRYVKKGDLILSNSMSYGKAFILQTDGFIHDGWFVLRLPENINTEFLFYAFSSPNVNEQIIKLSSGSVVKNISSDLVKKVDIPIPPLPEQKRIVEILDKAFAEIDKAKANAEKNLKNAKELFDSYLNNMLEKNKHLCKSLGNVCERVEYGSAKKSKSKGIVPVLRMVNIQNGKFDWNNLVYSDNEEDNSKYLLRYNDVLFNRTNSPELVGKTAIYKGEMKAIFAGYLIRIHRKETLLDADYLNYYLNSEMAINYGKTVVISSVNQANINGTKLKSYPIPLHPLKEQQSIVQKLDELSAVTKKIEETYKKQIEKLEELKKSILKKAFKGEL